MKTGKIQRLLTSKIFIWFILSSFQSNAQKIVSYNKQKSELYLMDTSAGKVAFMDTLTLLNMFNEYTFHIDNNRLFVCYCSYSVSGRKSYDLLYYIVNNSGKLKFTSSYSFNLDKLPTLKKLGLKVDLNDTGVCLHFDKGKINLIVLAYYQFLESEKDIDGLLKKISDAMK